MLKIYGTMKCPDCVACVNDFKEKNIAFELVDFMEDLQNFKEFMHLRDKNPIFDSVKENGGIGIPCILKEDGSYTFSWDEFLD